MIIHYNNDCKLIPIDLRQQINFIGKLENHRATMFFIIEKLEKTTSEFSQNSVIII